MEVSARETLLIETHCCSLTQQQFLCCPRHTHHRALLTSQGQSLESSELWCQLSLCWVRCVTGIVARQKYLWGLLASFQPVLRKWVFCELLIGFFLRRGIRSIFEFFIGKGSRSIFEPFIGKGNRSIFEPFSQFWPGRDKQQTAGETQAPLPYSGKRRLSVYGFFSLWRLLTAPQNAEWSFRPMFVPLQAAESVSGEAHMSSAGCY